MLALTGGKSTNVSVEDIRILIEGSKAKIGGLTTKGLDWLYQHMVSKPNETISIDKEHVDEIKQLIQKDGLTVKERE